jgi:hypothetical protein
LLLCATEVHEAAAGERLAEALAERS